VDASADALEHSPVCSRSQDPKQHRYLAHADIDGTDSARVTPDNGRLTKQNRTFAGAKVETVGSVSLNSGGKVQVFLD